MANGRLLQGKYVVGKSIVTGDATHKREDRVYVGEIKRERGEPLIVGMVADGIATADKVARGPQLAINAVVAELAKSQGGDIPDLIERAMQVANQIVYNDNQNQEKKNSPTLVVALIYGNRCFIGNVGSSRAYWAQENGTLLQLTHDHTFYNIHGGDPKAVNADEVVNTIGEKSDTQVDPGFYLKPDMTKEQAFQMGYAGLPLKPGEAIVLCSNGLIETGPANNRYAEDKEIVNALQTEYEQHKAAIKMVGVAEGRRATDNVSAVTIQYLSDKLLKQHQSRSEQAAQIRFLKRMALIIGCILMLALIGILGYVAIPAAFFPSATPTIRVVEITITPKPTLMPTATILPGKARVDAVYGKGGNVQVGQIFTLDTRDTSIKTSSDGAKIVVGEQGNTVGIMFWFAGSEGKVNFDAEYMKPLLESGALYVQPGNIHSEEVVHFAQQADMLALVRADAQSTVQASGMIVELIGNDIIIYCFEGKCSLDPGKGKDVSLIQVGYKRTYRMAPWAAGDPTNMTYAEKWDWNVKCHYCLFEIIPSPTPTPTVTTTGD